MSEEAIGVVDEVVAVQWGVQVNGEDRVRAESSQLAADVRAGSANRAYGLGMARVVSRSVRTGPWRAGGPGNQWGVRLSWQDGHREVHPMPSRYEAELWVIGYRGEGLPELVSRQVCYGDWE
jgi:hypothetical protein